MNSTCPGVTTAASPIRSSFYLHGAGGDGRRIFKRTNVAALTEKARVIVLGPLGYRPFGGYGDIYPVVATERIGALGTQKLRALANAAGPDGQSISRRARPAAKARQAGADEA